MDGSSILAVIFDFDDTLVPDSTTKLLEAHGIDTHDFWTNQVKKLVSLGFDPVLAYLNLLLENVGQDKSLGALTNDKLREFGKTLDDHFYVGLPEIFTDLRKMVDPYRDITVEFYIISGGLKEIIDGTKIVKDHFTWAYACQLAENPQTGILNRVKRCVTFTEKTRYLFEINKGLDPKDTASNPMLVNKDVPQQKRRIPFKNMIYVGDGITDVPCFSLIKSLGGAPFGVFDPTQQASAKKAFLDFLKPARVISIHAPRYREHDELGSLLRSVVAARCASIESERAQA